MHVVESDEGGGGIGEGKKMVRGRAAMFGCMRVVVAADAATSSDEVRIGRDPRFRKGLEIALQALTPRHCGRRARDIADALRSEFKKMPRREIARPPVVDADSIDRRFSRLSRGDDVESHDRKAAGGKI